ncbi:hypothetical protein [Microbacterium xylanilyticum]
MALSVRDFLGMPSYLRSREQIDALLGWGALSKGTRSNAEPWAARRPR